MSTAATGPVMYHIVYKFWWEMAGVLSRKDSRTPFLSRSSAIFGHQNRLVTRLGQLMIEKLVELS